MSIMGFLSGFEDFKTDITEEIKALLLQVSPAPVDCTFKTDTKKLALTSKSLTKPETPLKHPVPVKTCFSWDERKL
ncbi:MAG: hypothetical protein LBB80_03375 [Treponema sp.]|jgi:hypothetical protein|nr:hypothetical protein [Treponema sp.]